MPSDLTRHSRRLSAAELLEWVLDERVTSTWALVRWPVAPGDDADMSLTVAYKALWHLEADEDQQKTEPYYLDAQLAMLAQMAAYLKQGDDLPAYMLQPYDGRQPIRFYASAGFLSDTRQWAWHGLVRGWVWLNRVIALAIGR